jgi:hypothetical protein
MPRVLASQTQSWARYSAVSLLTYDGASNGLHSIKFLHSGDADA